MKMSTRRTKKRTHSVLLPLRPDGMDEQQEHGVATLGATAGMCSVIPVSGAPVSRCSQPEFGSFLVCSKVFPMFSATFPMFFFLLCSMFFFCFPILEIDYPKAGYCVVHGKEQYSVF